MAPTPFNESVFPENLRTSLIPIQHNSSATSNSKLHRNSFNNSTRTDVQNILSNNILKAKRDFEDFAESHRNLFQNNFTNQLNKMNSDINNSFKESNVLENITHFPILRNKGPFFQDPFFEECRRQFEKSVQDIVNKFGSSSSVSSLGSNNSLNNDITNSSNDADISNNAINRSIMNDAFKSYRNLRDSQLREENQAASIEHGDHQHKIVIDVKDFMGGDVQIKSFNNTIRIEGHNEASSQSSTNSSSSKRNFCKEFTLPGPVNMGSVNSTMSSDGILTITVPRTQPVSTVPQPASSKNSQSTSTDRVTFPREYDDMSISPSQTGRYVTINNHQQPHNDQSNTNSPTSHNDIRYPVAVEGAACPSYSRRPNGGYWKR